MKIALVLTNDWELFGDGSGDYFTLQHEPMRELLDAMRGNGGKITIMAEVAQQFAYLENANNHQQFKEISSSWEEICKAAIRQASDVQLHLHPQWFDYKLEGNKFNLNMANTVFGNLPSNLIEEKLLQSKDYLEKLLQPIDENYVCSVFRAGAYYIEPSSHVIQSLIKLKFRADTSVSKGRKVDGIYDYTDAHSHIKYWNVSKKSVKYKGGENLIEFPIYTMDGYDSDVLRKYAPSLYYQIKFGVNVPRNEIEWLDKRDKYKEILYPKENRFYKKNEKKDLAWLASKFLQKSSIQLDYDYLPATAFVHCLEQIYAKYCKANIIAFLPIIASGHIKDAYDNENMFKIMDLIKTHFGRDLEYWTISEVLNLIVGDEYIEYKEDI